MKTIKTSNGMRVIRAESPGAVLFIVERQYAAKLANRSRGPCLLNERPVHDVSIPIPIGDAAAERGEEPQTAIPGR
jgi:hypothetical protein